jgi:predicted dehydrogenase
MSSDRLNVGVVGAGILGSRHARQFAELAGARLAAVADLNRDRAAEVAGKYGAESFGDFRSMLDMPNLDAVVIATPDHLHVAPVTAALEAGKHVLVEKPLATTVADATKLVEAAKASNRILQVNYSQRFVPDYSWTKDQIVAGTLGRVLSMRSVMNRPISVPTEMINWAGASSPLFFMSSHHLDLMCWYADSPVQEVCAYRVNEVLRSRGIETDDVVQVLVKFRNGTIATVQSSWIFPNNYGTPESLLEIVGSERVVSLGRAEAAMVYSASANKSVNLATSHEINGVLYGAFRNSLQHFVDSALTGTEPSTSGANTLEVTRLQCAMLDSLEQGRPVVLDSPA